MVSLSCSHSHVWRNRVCARDSQRVCLCECGLFATEIDLSINNIFVSSVGRSLGRGIKRNEHILMAAHYVRLRRSLRELVKDSLVWMNFLFLWEMCCVQRTSHELHLENDQIIHSISISFIINHFIWMFCTRTEQHDNKWCQFTSEQSRMQIAEMTFWWWCY